MRRFASSAGSGYVEVACMRTSRSVPSVSTARSICSSVDMPVDRMTGLPVAATASSRPRSVTDAEAILYATTLRSSRKSTDGSSHGDANQSRPRSVAWSPISMYWSRSNSTR